MLLSLLRKRRSIRKYQPRPIEKEKIDTLIEVLLRSPSSRSRNPWQYVLVTDPGLLAKLAQCKQHGSAFLNKAAMAVVICADPECCDVWIEDCSVAATILQLTAEELGLGSCWVQVRLRNDKSGRASGEYVRELLQIPDHLVVGPIIGVGYPDEQKPGHETESLDYGKIYFNLFGQK